MYSFINNPKTNRKVSILGKIGKKILLNYINHLGGNPIADDSSGNDREAPPPPKDKRPETSRGGKCRTPGCEFRTYHWNAHKYQNCPECGTKNVGWIVYRRQRDKGPKINSKTNEGDEG